MPFDPDFGSVPDWVEAVATAGAFFGVWYTLRQANEDRRQAEAGNIDYWVHLDQRLTLTVVNNNKTAINDCFAHTPLARGYQPPRNYVALGKIPPGEWSVPYAEIDPDRQTFDDNLGLLIPHITFRDSHDRVWRRTARGELKHGRAIRTEELLRVSLKRGSTASRIPAPRLADPHGPRADRTT
jgi:hypothetical protein